MVEFIKKVIFNLVKKNLKISENYESWRYFVKQKNKQNFFIYNFKVLLKPFNNFCLKNFFLSFTLSMIFALKEKYRFF